MLRALEHGYDVRMVQTAQATFSVDTPADLAHVSRLMQDDALLSLSGSAMSGPPK